MGGIYSPPTFIVPQPPILLGTTNQVLTVTAPNVLGFAAASGGGGTLGTYLAPATLSAGATNNYNPAGFGTGVGRMDITPGAGGSNLTGLAAGADGQIVLICNISATDTLTLNNQNAGSSAVNRFRFSGDLALPPGARSWCVYYGGSVNRWSMG